MKMKYLFFGTLVGSGVGTVFVDQANNGGLVALMIISAVALVFIGLNETGFL